MLRRGPAASAPEQEALTTVLDRLLRPERIALALAAEPAARPTVSSEIITAAVRSTTAETPVLFTPPAARRGFEPNVLAAEDGVGDAAEPVAVPSPPFTRGTWRSLASPKETEIPSRALVSPGAASLLRTGSSAHSHP